MVLCHYALYCKFYGVRMLIKLNIKCCHLPYRTTIATTTATKIRTKFMQLVNAFTLIWNIIKLSIPHDDELLWNICVSWRQLNISFTVNDLKCAGCFANIQIIKLFTCGRALQIERDRLILNYSRRLMILISRRQKIQRSTTIWWRN